MKGDIFALIPYHDTGNVYENYAVNWYYGYSNLFGSVLNIFGEVFAGLEDVARAIGFSETDIQATKDLSMLGEMGSLISGVGEASAALDEALGSIGPFLKGLLADERGSADTNALLGLGGSQETNAASAMTSGSGPDTVYIEKYITDRLQAMTDVSRAELENNPGQFFGYDYTQSPQWQLRFEAGHLIESDVGNALSQDWLSNLVEPISYSEQAGGGGLLGDFRLQQPFQDMWGVKQWDVTTPWSAWQKLQSGKDRIWLLYPSFNKPP